jgi:hypothetical protein
MEDTCAAASDLSAVLSAVAVVITKVNAWPYVP